MTNWKCSPHSKFINLVYCYAWYLAFLKNFTPTQVLAARQNALKRFGTTHDTELSKGLCRGEVAMPHRMVLRTAKCINMILSYA